MRTRMPFNLACVSSASPAAVTLALALEVPRQQTWLAADRHSPEVTQVQGSDGIGFQALGNCDDHAVDEAEVQGAVTLTDLPRALEIGCLAPFNSKCRGSQVG